MSANNPQVASGIVNAKANQNQKIHTGIFLITKKLIFTLLAAICLTITVNAQCETHKYVYIADKVANLTLKASDFSDGHRFFTIDTVDASDFNVASDYRVYTNSDSLIKDFSSIFKIKKWEGSYFNYYELIDNSFFQSDLHISFLINDKDNTFKIDIWNNVEDIFKIDGLTILKLPKKIN